MIKTKGGEKQMTEAAKTAKAIREELKIAFPGIKFQVRSENFSMGDAVHISYNNGVPTIEVEKIVKKYQYGSFDGMTDMYENSNNRNDIPQAKYVQVDRSIDPEIREAKKMEIAKQFGIVNITDENEWQKTFNDWSDWVVGRKLRDMTFA